MLWNEFFDKARIRGDPHSTSCPHPLFDSPSLRQGTDDIVAPLGDLGMGEMLSTASMAVTRVLSMRNGKRMYYVYVRVGYY